MDYYEILGVAQDATVQDIKKAFRQIARECHPDVAGDDDEAAERFKVARKAYETLIDPVTRSRYDRRGQRKFKRGSFFDAFYRNTGGAQPSDPKRKKRYTYGSHDAGGGPGVGRNKRHDPGNDLNLDDLMNGFGDFGFGGAGPSAARPPRDGQRAKPPPEPTVPRQGDDVEVEIEIPADLARRGGTWTVSYKRLQREDYWGPVAEDPGRVQVDDVADVRVVPGTRDGAILRERGLGDVGTDGGPYGDLLVRVRVKVAPDPGKAPPPKERAPESTDDWLDISVVEALLGGRIDFSTPQGPVRVAIPPGTSSGARLRLKGKGPTGPDGRPSDLYVQVRIVVPRQLDARSQELIEEFARLNPGTPRSQG